MQLDVATLTAALLHDVLEDTPTTPEELGAVFGEDVLILVGGVIISQNDFLVKQAIFIFFISVFVFKNNKIILVLL